MNLYMAQAFVGMGGEALSRLASTITDECPAEGGYCWRGDWVSTDDYELTARDVLDFDPDQRHPDAEATLRDVVFCIANGKSGWDVAQALYKGEYEFERFVDATCDEAEDFIWTTPED